MMSPTFISKKELIKVTRPYQERRFWLLENQCSRREYRKREKP